MIYFDNAATTKPLEVALKSFIEISENNFANPSSLHKEGKNSRQIIEKSKEEFKKIINANDGELIFTSSATLSNNIAICGYFNYLKGKIKNRKLKILYCEADHPSIVDTIKNLSDIELRGILYPQLYEKLQKYKNKSNYEISGNYKNESETDDIEEYLLSLYYNEIEKFKPDILVLQWVNNENGLILPVEKIARYARKYNENILIHADAVQGFLKLPLFILDNIDSVSFSAH
ncbi:MAG: aminotransferase class V-fold PLP-dependent enzyme, partial [Exilispira sp.]